MSSRRSNLLRLGASLLVAICLSPAPALLAIQRDTYKDIRSRYEGLSLRLRVDLKAAGRATEPNVVSLDGVKYPSERSPILFSALDTVYVQRITNEGGTRLGLTVYRSKEEADRLRASAIPAPSMGNPNYDRTLAAFAQQGSTSVILELKAGKKDGPGQLAEIEPLLDRLFYLKSEPTREELETFVRRHSGWPISRLRDETGLPDEEIRALLKESADTGGENR
jgi:hypothetical protein